MKRRRLHPETFYVDFIRRTIPPSLDAFCRPAEPKLCLTIRESWTQTTEGCRLASDIALNNPITNVLQGTLEYPGRGLEFSPLVAHKGLNLELPLGFYPLAQVRYNDVGEMLGFEKKVSEDHIAFRLVNNTRLKFKELKCRILIDEDATPLGLLKIEKEPNNLSHRISYELGGLTWKIVNMLPGIELRTIIRLSRSVDDALWDRLRFVAKGSFDVDHHHLRCSFVHPRYPETRLIPSIEGQGTISVTI